MKKPTPTALGLGITFPALAFLAVAARFWARRIKSQKLMADDYMIIPALIFSVVTGVLLICASAFGDLGKHEPVGPNGEVMPNSQLQTLSKIRWIDTIFVALSITFTKLSVILLYHRIFTSTKFRMVAYMMLVLVSVWGIAFTLGYLLQCIPLRQTYEMTAGETRRCFNTVTFNTVACASTIVLDVAILTMPWPIIWRLQMSLPRKIAVTAIFLLGGVVTAASIGRLVAHLQVSKIISTNVDHDVTWYLRTLIYWTIPESSLATIGACLPTLRPIFPSHSSESIIQNIRSPIWQSSGKSSKRSKSSEIERNLSTESSVGLNKASEDVGGYDGIENETTVVPLRNIAPAKHARGDGITVQYDIWQSNSQV